MAYSDLKSALKECFRDSEVIKILQEGIIVPAVACELKVLRGVMYEHGVSLNDLEQYSRKNNVVISGVPEEDGESALGIVIELGRVLGVSIRPEEVDAAHRFGKPSGKPRPILARFVTYSKRDEFYRERKNLREIDLPRDSTFTPRTVKDVYLSDNLTRYSSAVMYAARVLKREGRLGSCWTDSGRMKIKIGARDGPTKIVRCAADIRKLVGEHPALDAADELLHSLQPGAGPARHQNSPSTAPDSARAAVPAGSTEAAGHDGSAGADAAGEVSGTDTLSPDTPAPTDSRTGPMGRWCQAGSGARRRAPLRSDPGFAPGSAGTPGGRSPADAAHQSRRGRGGERGKGRPK